jgi:hypothetical protein
MTLPHFFTVRWLFRVLVLEMWVKFIDVKSHTKGATGNTTTFVSGFENVPNAESAQEYCAPASGVGGYGKHRPCSSPFIVNASSDVWRLAKRVGDSQIYLGDANGRTILYATGIEPNNVMVLDLNGKGDLCNVNAKWMPPAGDNAGLFALYDDY